MRICTACGKTTADDKVYCPVCGTKLPEPTQPDCTNTIDEINLVNTRLRSVPAKPNNTAKHGIIIGVLSLLVVIMIVVIICFVVGGRPKSSYGYNYNTPGKVQNGNSVEMNNNIEYDYDNNEITQNNNINQGGNQIINQGNTSYKNPQPSINQNSPSVATLNLKPGEELYFSDTDFDHGCIIIDSNYVYIDVSTADSIEFARAKYTVSDNIITLGPMDTYKTISGEIPSTLGINDDFRSYHILSAGTKLKYTNNTITIIDFEEHWIARSDAYRYPDPYKNNNKLTACFSPIFEEFRIGYEKPKQTEATKISDVVIIGDEGGEQYFYYDGGYTSGEYINFDSNYVYLHFEYLGDILVGKGTYTINGNTITLGSIDLYCKTTADGLIYADSGKIPKLHIMDAGAEIEYNDISIRLSGFDGRWNLSYPDDGSYMFPEHFSDGSVLNKFN